MLNVSTAYKNACSKPVRKSYIIAKYGNFDKEAKGKVSEMGGNSTPFSNLNKLINGLRATNYNYVSCEPNRCKLDGTYYFLKDKTEINQNENVAFWSSYCSNSNKLFTNNPSMTISFSEQVEFTEITIYFQEVCDSFTVKYYLNNTQVAIREITNNNNLIVETYGALSSNYFDKLEIIFTKTKEAYRYVRVAEIDIGVEQRFGNDEIISINVIDELSIDSSELSANSLELVVRDNKGDYSILNPNNRLKLIRERREIVVYYYLYVDGVYQEVPLGTFLLKEFDSQKQKLILTAYDDTYFMNDIYYGSKFYQNEEITTILTDLFNYFNYTSYIIDEELQGIKLTGYVPPVEFREALRLICEAGCCVINKNRYGKTYIFKTYDPFSKIFRRREIFKENPTRNMFNNKINIIEYNYTNEIYDLDLYNATLTLGEHWIVFDKPVKPASIDKAEVNNNYSIDYVSATSCKVTVTSSTTNVKLIGYRYGVTSVVKHVPEDYDFDNDYAISKVTNHLITINNSDSVASWKLGRNEIKQDFQTYVAPYIEVGDTCVYETPFSQKSTFIPTRIEFTKSILQDMEGE